MDGHRTRKLGRARADRVNRASSRASRFESLENRLLLASELFFAATTAADGRELWSYTGTGSPVRRSQIQAGAASGNPTELTAYNGRIYFAADDGTTGQELWTFNGTSSVRVRDINTGAGSSSPEDLT